MAVSTATEPTRATSDLTWLRVVQVCVAMVIPAMIILAVVMSFFTVTSEGDFHYTADYWLTAPGLPLTLGCIGIAMGLHKLQHGADGRLGTVGTWITVVASVELFVQLAASLIQGAEVRWGPSYPVAVLFTFIGLALLAAGSWRTGLLPRWMLGLLPFVWIIGSLASFGPTPLLLVVFLAVFAVTLTRRIQQRQAGVDGR
jgi:hypothetical protein